MQLVVDQLTLQRGLRTLLAGLSFTVAAGEALVLTGPNGVGKTTLLRTIAGLRRPEAGSVRLVDDRLSGEARDEEDAIGPRCHFIGHLNAVKPALSVARNLAFWRAYLGGAAGREEAALDRLDLAAIADLPAGYLSTGQRRRLGLARLVLADRPLWLLDEPAVSLDSASRRLLSGLADAHLAAGGLLIAATHQPLELARERELRLAPPHAAPGAVA